MPLKRLWVLPGVFLVLLGAILLAESRLHVTKAAFIDACKAQSIPWWKCTPTNTPINPHAVNVSWVTPQWPNPPQIVGGPDFFSAPTMQQLQNLYGSLEVFRYQGSQKWVLIGDGMNPTGSNPATPGGALVAVEDCTGLGASCLDPNAPHNVNTFVVVGPPDRHYWPLKVMNVRDGRLLTFGADGSAGAVMLDLNTLVWYPGADPNNFNLLSGTGPLPTPLSTAKPTPGILLSTSP